MRPTEVDNGSRIGSAREARPGATLWRPGRMRLNPMALAPEPGEGRPDRMRATPAWASVTAAILRAHSSKPKGAGR